MRRWQSLAGTVSIICHILRTLRQMIFMFQFLQYLLKVKCFEDITKVGGALQEFFHSKGADSYLCGIEKLPKKWQEIIDIDGEYFD